jgi:uncharacterized Zn-finger protein
MYKTTENSITEKIPWLIDEWNFEKNGDLYPENVAWRSNKKIWWLCKEKHSFQMSPNKRISLNKETGEVRVSVCPFCSRKKVLTGYNDLATTNPELIKQWDYKKNILKPTEITSGSKKKIWWLCDKGHSWKAAIYSRKNRGCPYCSGKAILQGYNDLATLNPKLASEWHPTNNKGVTPNIISLNSHKKYWWLCDKRHEWEISPHNRNNGSGCPYCSGRFAIKGETDLATLNPELAGEWHPTKNKNETPKNVPLTSHKNIWWLCENNHVWQASIYSRTNGNGCPYCSGQKPIVGETDLETVMPEIAVEWNYERNRGKTPNMFTKSSNKRVWWKCEFGHEWRTAICTRTGVGTGCPECAKKRRN